MVDHSTLLKTATLLLVGVFGLLILANPSTAVAQSNQEKILGQLCDNGPGESNFDANCNSNVAESRTGRIFRQIVQTALWIVGILSGAMVIIGGLMYVFSSGGPEQTARARSTIIYAIVGLAVAFSGIFLLEFVLDQGSALDNTIDDPHREGGAPLQGGVRE